MRRFATMIAALICLSANAFGQDFKRVIESVGSMETTLRQMIANEVTQRNAEVADLRRQLASLDSSLGFRNEFRRRPGLEGSLDAPSLRLR